MTEVHWLRRASQMMAEIHQVVANHRTRFFSEPAAEGFRAFLSVGDARELDEASRRQGDLFPVSEIRDGDTGTIVGIPFTADASLRPGRAFIGYRINVPDVEE